MRETDWQETKNQKLVSFWFRFVTSLRSHYRDQVLRVVSYGTLSLPAPPVRIQLLLLYQLRGLTATPGVIARSGATKQSVLLQEQWDCFAALAMTLNTPFAPALFALQQRRHRPQPGDDGRQRLDDLVHVLLRRPLAQAEAEGTVGLMVRQADSQQDVGRLNTP